MLSHLRHLRNLQDKLAIRENRTVSKLIRNGPFPERARVSARRAHGARKPISVSLLIFHASSHWYSIQSSILTKMADLAHSSQVPTKTSYNTKKPGPAYFPQKGSKIYADQDLYTKIANAPKTLVESHLCKPRSGYAVKVPAKSLIRLTTPEGPQVCDLNIWNLHNPRERFWAARTRQLHSAHVSKFDRLWSILPFLRPLVTITADTLGGRHTEWGGRIHDTLGTRCDPYVDKLISGEENDFHCHSNLMEASPSTKDDYFEMFAEQDLLIAISACPGGDLSNWDWGEKEGDDKMVDNCRPLGIEIYKLDDESVLEGWTPPEYAPYKGRHGLKDPVQE